MDSTLEQQVTKQAIYSLLEDRDVLLQYCTEYLNVSLFLMVLYNGVIIVCQKTTNGRYISRTTKLRDGKL